jgi:hypothetical protein
VIAFVNVTARRLASQAPKPRKPQPVFASFAVTKIGAVWLMTLGASAYQTSESPPPRFSELTLWKVTGQAPPLAVVQRRGDQRQSQLTVMLWPLDPLALTNATISSFGTVV